MGKIAKLGLGLCMLVGLAGTGARAGLANETISLCQEGGRLDQELASNVEALGWLSFSEDQGQAFSSVFFDGIVIGLSGGPFDPIDWDAAKSNAAQQTEAVLEAWKAGAGFGFYYSQDSFLVIVDNSDAQVDQIRCIYAGSIDLETSELMKTVQEMDQMAEHPHISDVFYRMSQSSQKPSTDGSGKLGFISDTLLARYTSSAKTFLGRDAAAQLSFSIITSRVR